MKNRIIASFLLICPFIASGQYEIRPILDSTAACSYYDGLAVERYFDPDAPDKYIEKVHMEIFYIVEKMPIPKFELIDLENSLDKKIQLNEQEETMVGKMHFQCIVNCKGEAGDFQVISCPDELSNIGFQVFCFVREKMVNWQPGNQRNHNVDVLIKIQVSLNNGKFEVMAPVV